MIIGYILEHVLAVVLVLLLWIAANSSNSWIRQKKAIWTGALASFHDCATLLALSIQIASVVVLIRMDFGISTTNMGDDTVRITQAISILTLLPLLYGVACVAPMVPAADSIGTEKKKGTDSIAARASLRFGLFVLCWLLSLYPFCSKLNSVFGPSDIGNTPSSAISDLQWQQIEDVCFAGTTPITVVEATLMTAFSMVASFLVCMITLGRIIFSGLCKHHARSRTSLALKEWSTRYETQLEHVQSGVLLVVIPFMACGLFWVVFRLRYFQIQMATATGNTDTDGQWAFGQIVAVTVFMPVLVECWFLSQHEDGD